MQAVSKVLAAAALSLSFASSAVANCIPNHTDFGRQIAREYCLYAEKVAANVQVIRPRYTAGQICGGASQVLQCKDAMAVAVGADHWCKKRYSANLLDTYSNVYLQNAYDGVQFGCNIAP